jgi:two-component system cell cycle sensor histidine kinase/response regulator CckA
VRPARLEDQRLSLAIEQGPAAVIITDVEGRIEYVNRRFTEITGYLPGEVLHRTPRVLRSGFTAPAVYEQMWATIRAGDAWRGELCNRRKDGGLYWHSMSISPVCDDTGQVSGFVAVQEDITEQRRIREELAKRERQRQEAEAALRRSESWFRTLIERAHDLIAVVLPDGTFRYASPSFDHILGHEPSGLLGTAALDLVHPEDRESVKQVLQGMHQAGAVRALEYRCRHEDGSWHLIDATARNLLDDPVVGGFVLNGRDATERVALEAQFRQAQKLDALGQLVGGVAHDFNNILAVILASSHMLREDLPSDHACQADVLEIEKAGERAAALTRQLLAFTRQQVLVPQVLDLNALVQNISRMLGRLLGADVALSNRLAVEPVIVKADPGQLEQVLLNLAVNGRDAMSGSGALLIETSVVDRDDSYVGCHGPMRPGRYAMLAVTDTGSGMSPDVQARVFEPFFTTKEPGKGTGLGLSTVYGIVKQSEGFIWLYSEPGVGTRFKIYLPHVDQAVGAARAATSDDLPRGTETVLIAEDNAAVRQAACRALERSGYTVLQANGPDALELVSRHEGPIDLLLSDVVMPKVNGPKLAQVLRKLRPNLRVLYMSGYIDGTMRSRLFEVGGGYLQKPFTVANLVRKVRELLDAT